jgi:uncharacterized membrane protein YiaA
MKPVYQKPSAAFVGASWVALMVSAGAFVVALWNDGKMPQFEKYFFFSVLMFGLFAVVSLQKAVRDRMEDIPVTGIYYGLAWFSTALCVAMLLMGVYQSGHIKGNDSALYILAYLMALFAAIAVQKNTRDAKLGEDSMSSND